ncbi:MAG: hypothetical protein IPM61_03380 [Chlorobi bacterium]|nr:MAG: hypothetical protein UZ07_CHB004000920 [Chlorobi bacterium OLB7]MBK8910347.1 hypothetical protein [Chlorobiota bacterium]MBX7217249.1 hypothetical protein [Candidatus Kapabacteria bacterium]
MFGKKKEPITPLPGPISIPVLNGNAALTLEQKLELEARHCPTCGYSIINPMNDRCPRCFGVVPLSEHTNCGECSHQGNCTYAGRTR